MGNDHAAAAFAFEHTLLEEARHRFANEMAASLASLHLVRAGLDSESSLINEAIRRLECQVKLERMILQPDGQDLGDNVLTLCSLISATRIDRPKFRVSLREGILMPDRASRSLILMVGYELLTNAAKRNASPDAHIRVKIGFRSDSLCLRVANRCYPNVDQPSGGEGLAILQRIADGIGGRISGGRRNHVFVVRAAFPAEHLSVTRY